MTLQELIDHASGMAEHLFAQFGEVRPFLVANTDKGEHHFVPVPLRAGTIDPEVVSLIAAGLGMVRFVLVAEALKLETDNEADTTASIAGHPDTIEIVMLSGEERDAPTVTGWRPIVRPETGPPHLGPLELCAYRKADGRLLGLLMPQGTAQ